MKDNSDIDPAGRSLSPDQGQALQALAGMIIPASQAYGVPGADDPIIFARIADAAKADVSGVVEGLDALDDLSRADHDERFVALDDARRAEIASAFARSDTPQVQAIASITAQCYYSDDRVMTALGMEDRPPFPRGFEVEQGDWSLLDPVKQRPKFYREV